MSATRSFTEVSRTSWFALGLVAALIASFAAYVQSENQVNRLSAQRHLLLLYADELRQSSDDLTRMVRSYAATGNLIYKEYYEDIVAIQDGKLPRPLGYHNNYWHVALANGRLPSELGGRQIPLLDLIRECGASDVELQMVYEAKANADALNRIEVEAINRVSNATHEAAIDRNALMKMLYGESYDRAKANIITPIENFYNLVDARTLRELDQSKQIATFILFSVIGLAAGLAALLWYISSHLRTTLGGSINQVYEQLVRLGKGEFSAHIPITKDNKNSILGWLAETQRNLRNLQERRELAEAARSASDARYSALFANVQVGIVIFVQDPSQPFVAANEHYCQMLGYTHDELMALYPHEVLAESELDNIGPAIDSLLGSETMFREWRLKRKDGSEFTVETIGTTLPDGTMMAMVRDISARKQAEEKLRSSEENLAITLQSIGDAVIVTDIAGKITRMNPTAERLTGWTFAQAESKPLNEVFRIVSADTLQPLTNPVEQVISRGAVVGLANGTTLIARDGTKYHIADSAAPIRDSAGDIVGVVLVFSDVTERYLSEAALRRAEERFRRTFKLIPNPLTLQDPHGVMIDCSDAFCDITGFSREEIIGRTTSELGIWVDSTEREAMRARLLTKGQIDKLELKLKRRDGEIRIMQLSARYLASDPEPLLLGLAHDITDRKRAELALQESALHTQAILDNMFDGVITISEEGLIESFNAAASRIFGYSAADVMGKSISLLMPGYYQTECEVFSQLHRTPHNYALNAARELDGQRINGEIFPLSLSVSEVLRAGKITFVGLVRDISQQRQDEEEIYRLAFYDPLTNLPNRRLLYDRLQQAMITSSRTDQHGALMFLDLDYFKQLNDSLGHDLGDILLQQVATRLQTCVREGDSVARMGGDEFVMLMEALSPYPNEAAAQAEMIADKVLHTLSEPYSLREYSYLITPSIGIVLFLHQTDSIDELLKKADVAMYQAKTAGRNTARFFDPTMQAAVSVRIELEKSMRVALTQREFRLHYQLQVDRNGVPIGVEALMRWNHGKHGVISPDAFIPLAEETGMILPLGQWVLETACAQLVEWAKSTQTAHWCMAVNVSVIQFSHPDFVATVKSALQKTGADPRHLKLELTETMLAKDVEDVIVKMVEIKALGVTFSLDDFGTGYSSLSYLKRLPLDQLKIDQSFVRDLLTDQNDATIARTVVALGHSLGLSVIAEGVETAEQQAVLAEMGCDAYQGYYFARPTEAENLIAAVAHLPVK